MGAERQRWSNAMDSSSAEREQDAWMRLVGGYWDDETGCGGGRLLDTSCVAV